MPKTKGKRAPRKKKFLRYGELLQLATTMGISQSYLCDLLAGRRFFTFQMMKKLSLATTFLKGRGRRISFEELRTFSHPIFHDNIAID